mmetsp:Transcript_15292/g.34735  ORF Transcript_15292/g.34735 Transcript_15292/m.34735 type:complete len:454 (+) Transcript_15292:30-1391(+)
MSFAMKRAAAASAVVCGRTMQSYCEERKLAEVPHLRQWQKNLVVMANPMVAAGKTTEVVSVDPPEMVLRDIVEVEGKEAKGRALRRAGAAGEICWDPSEVRAAIVTCGGLSPGLNNVVKGVVGALWSYGVRTVYGIPFGYRGFYAGDYKQLTPENVSLIHHEGGSALGSSRGGFDEKRIMDSLEMRGVNQVYIVGGDGTHRGAYKLHEEAMRRGKKIAIIGVPKTIDNDIGVIDRSFGFKTCIEEACKVIECARIEAASAPNGVCVVKLMGRDSGFIATHTTMAARDVDLCLVPEVPLVTEGEKSVFRHLRNVVKRKGYAVVVVAEGAGQDVLGATTQTDESGNKRYKDIGVWMKEEIGKHFKASGMESNVRYIDPSYIIRSVPANADDSEYCMLLAQAAVHGAMAGFSGFSAGLVNNRSVMIPMTLIGETSPCKLRTGRRWARVVDTTGQPL